MHHRNEGKGGYFVILVTTSHDHLPTVSFIRRHSIELTFKPSNVTTMRTCVGGNVQSQYRKKIENSSSHHDEINFNLQKIFSSLFSHCVSHRPTAARVCRRKLWLIPSHQTLQCMTVRTLEEVKSIFWIFSVSTSRCVAEKKGGRIVQNRINEQFYFWQKSTKNKPKMYFQFNNFCV